MSFSIAREYGVNKYALYTAEYLKNKTISEIIDSPYLSPAMKTRWVNKINKKLKPKNFSKEKNTVNSETYYSPSYSSKNSPSYSNGNRTSILSCLFQLIFLVAIVSLIIYLIKSIKIEDNILIIIKTFIIPTIVGIIIGIIAISTILNKKYRSKNIKREAERTRVSEELLNSKINSIFGTLFRQESDN